VRFKTYGEFFTTEDCSGRIVLCMDAQNSNFCTICS